MMHEFYSNVLICSEVSTPKIDETAIQNDVFYLRVHSVVLIVVPLPNQTLLLCLQHS
jgi:hypothetical protein